MNAIRTLMDQRARGFILFSVFIALLWLVALLFIVDLIALYNQNARDTETATMLSQKKANAPAQIKMTPALYVYLEANQTLAAASLQRNITKIATDLEVRIRSFETMASRADDPPGRLAAEIQFEIDESHVTSFLHSIENFKPAIVIERLSLQAPKDRETRANNRLQGSIDLVSAWQVAP